MELITKSQLSTVRDVFEKSNGLRSLNESINLKNVRNSTHSEVTIFLSHKHEQRKELEGAIALLKSVKASIYVDWADEGMPKTTSGGTAIRLKEKIKSNKKFILLATEAAIKSTWCNWELGVGDVHKYIKDIALLVVKDDYSTWSGSEYLQIYPTIGFKDSFRTSDYEVKFPDGHSVGLVDWLNS